MIKPGLERIAALVRGQSFKWRAIHVAGTNGKGSICSYVDAVLQAAQVKTGRFTSPHLVDRWDCITINSRPISQSLFQDAEALVQERNRDQQIGASQFEVLTATAFEVFEREQVAVGVVECGMGGLQDATNVLVSPLVTVVASISFDHQKFLGNTLAEIARHKAGIAKAGSPFVVDGQNPHEVLESVSREAVKHDVVPVVVPDDSLLFDKYSLNTSGMPSHQKQNMRVALTTLEACWPQLQTQTPLGSVVSSIMSASVPGRLQLIDLSPITDRPTEALLDGAHNTASWTALSSFVSSRSTSHETSQNSSRSTDETGERQAVAWVLAASKGKPIDEMLSLLVRPGDSVHAVEFGPVDGMPWVQPEPSFAVSEAAADRLRDGAVTNHGRDLVGALKAAATAAAQDQQRAVVVAGSLYLVSDVLRLLRLRGAQ